MRWIWVLALVAVVALSAVWSAGRETATMDVGPTTTSSVVTQTIPLPVPAPVPIPFPEVPPLPANLPTTPPGGGEVINVHSRVDVFRAGQTVWSTSGVVALTVRIDKAAPKVGEAVTFEVVASTAGLACCGVVLRPGGDAVFDAGGGLACLPADAAGRTTATFRWVHVYESSGRFPFNVIARAGTCSEATGTGGISGVIEVT